MDSYKRPYFTLFCAICETIEELEQILRDENLSRKNATALWVQVKKVKTGSAINRRGSHRIYRIIRSISAPPCINYSNRYRGVRFVPP